MTALAGTKWSVGYIVDGLLSASFTLYMGNLALQGLSKVAVVARRGVNEALKACYIDTRQTGSLASRAAAFIPARISTFFQDDSGYNETHKVPGQVPELTPDGKVILDDGVLRTKAGMVDEPKFGTITLLVSGLGLCLFALVALEAKEALWRPANPILNNVLSYISPFRVVLGQSWVAHGINELVGSARASL
jgi:hypothetical protein